MSNNVTILENRRIDHDNNTCELFAQSKLTRIVNKIKSIWNRFIVAPLLTPFPALLNKWKFGHCLTCTSVLPNDCLKADSQGQVDDIKKKVMALENGSRVLIHVPVTGKGQHSTAMVVGKEDDKYYGFYFDIQGNAPTKLRLYYNIEKEGPTMNSAQLYETILPDDVAPECKESLVYQSSFAQKDYVSCTAYTALFFQTINAKKTKNSLVGFMQEINNHRQMSWRAARDLANRLGQSFGGQPASYPSRINDSFEEL